MSTTKLSTPLKWWGGKSYLAEWIISLMRPHLNYVEPFAGSLQVLFAKNPEDPRFWVGDYSREKGTLEVVNDLDGRIANFWRVLRDPDLYPEFVRRASVTPYSRPGWEVIQQHVYGDDAVADALALFVLIRQSRGAAGTNFAPSSTGRTRRLMGDNVSSWLSAVVGLPEAHARLIRVEVEQMDASALIRQRDDPLTQFYLDPPYLPDTRQSPNVYGCEMTVRQHQDMLDTIRWCKGKVILSGYPNELYDRELTGWNRHTKDIANHAAGGNSKRRMTEVVWCNF